MRVLSVIPARGGSKRIRRKNLRLFNGKPLILHAVETALRSNHVTDVVVTTDSEEIAEVVESHVGNRVKIRRRPVHLAEDDVTLSPVVYDAVNWYEDEYGLMVDVVVVQQPTSPNLLPSTLDAALEFFFSSHVDTVLSVTDETGLYWVESGGVVVPLYEERKNSQWLPKMYRENGAFFISRRDVLTFDSHIGNQIRVFILSKWEAFDIDDPFDWYMAERASERIRMLFVVVANSLVGYGHLYRALTLADMFIGNDVVFFIVHGENKAVSIVKDRGYNVLTGKLTDVAAVAGGFDILINDILDTDLEYMRLIRDKVPLIVNFEDLGEGTELADLVINALYEKTYVLPNHRYGYQYAVVDERFLIYPPNQFSPEAKDIMITFGGVDLNNLTVLALKAVYSLWKRGLIRLESVKVITGPAYKFVAELSNLLSEVDSHYPVIWKRSVSNMAREMKGIDLAITSNGRTVYELASMRVPIISIAQNDRETLHLFARYNKGVKYLGIACNVTQSVLEDTLVQILLNNDVRRQMFDSLPVEEIRTGPLRVKDLILRKYREVRLL